MIDVRGVFEQEVAEQLARRPELADQVNAVLQIEIAGPGGGLWAIDLTKGASAPRLTAGAHSRPKVRVWIDVADFDDLWSGRLRWTDAFVHGKIDVKGDLITAVKLRKLFARLAG